MKPDIDKTKEFYRSYTPCNCIACENYYAQIEEKYPELCRFLNGLGIDALRPWELGSVEIKKGRVDYVMCQYLAIGSCEEDFRQTIGEIEIIRAAACPKPQNLKDDYFVLEFSLSLPRVIGVKKIDGKLIRRSFKELKRRFGFRKGKVYYPLINIAEHQDIFYTSEELAVRHEQEIIRLLLEKYGIIYKSGEKMLRSLWGEVVNEYNFGLNYGGWELVYFDSDYEWLIYVSHEQTVTFAGSIVPDMKMLLQE